MIGQRKRLGIKRLMWFQWRDVPGPPECTFCAAGLQTHHLHSKPAWRAYKRFAKR